MKKVLLPIIILLSSCSSESSYVDETEEIISINMINNILELSECLSIEATPGEKFGIVQASTIKTSIKDKESIEKYIKQSQEDFDFLIQVSEKKCPSSLNRAITSIKNAKSKKARIAAEDVLQQIIVSSISGEIITAKEKREIFENNYKSF
ncbi:hypothetical protein [Acinetobacter haemolyticus]|jgi:hypothetical protein|uniref:hypothetical protein n=1 Tax=Acinetobacter haemolyticus TaxID=29430 RepID=UPI000381213B|nr:hypothetical protein [Acinetobacter haemolyticus]